jgi:uncharacterized protein (TIGR03437 family)
MAPRTVFLPLLVCSAAWAQTNLQVLNAASGHVFVAPGSTVSAFGASLAAVPGSATSLPLPTVLAGLHVLVTDCTGTARLAAMIFVSPGQVNFILPQGTAPGSAAVELRNGSVTVALGYAVVQQPAPGLFSADGDSIGVAAAIAVETPSAGPQRSYPVFQCNPILQTCWAVPIVLGFDKPVSLALFGTGIRLGQYVTVVVANQAVPVLYAGPQGGFPGLDQINVAIPPVLRGVGLVHVTVNVDGQRSNSVQLLIP